MRRRGFILALLLAAVAGGGAHAEKKSPPGKKRAPAQSKKLLEKQQGTLNNLTREIEKKETQVKNLLQRESSIISMLDNLDRKIDQADERRQTLEARRQALRDELRRKSDELVALERDVERLRQATIARLRALERLGNGGYVKALLSLDDLRGLHEAQRVVYRLVAHDLSLMREFSRKQAELEDRSLRLRDDNRLLAETVAQLEEQNREIRTQKKRQKHLLNLTRNQRDFSSRSLAELKEAAANLQALIDKLAREGFPSDFEFSKGSLPLPAEATVVGRYGRSLDPKKQLAIARNGIELDAKRGEPVRAVYDGKVIYSGWFTGYGKIVILDHGGGYYSMSAHLDKISASLGEKVAQGDVLGQVGETGSLKGPLLYFELRFRGQAVDPLPWFNRLKVRVAQ